MLRRIISGALVAVTWPSGAIVTGTGGPNMSSRNTPLHASTASRTDSASSRCSGIRQSSLFSGSAFIPASSAFDCWRKAVEVRMSRCSFF